MASTNDSNEYPKRRYFSEEIKRYQYKCIYNIIKSVLACIYVKAKTWIFKTGAHLIQVNFHFLVGSKIVVIFGQVIA